MTDPPYIISQETGMNKHYNTVLQNKNEGVEFVKTEEEWEEYKVKKNIKSDTNGKKDNYMKYGTMLVKNIVKRLILVIGIMILL